MTQNENTKIVIDDFNPDWQSVLNAIDFIDSNDDKLRNVALRDLMFVIAPGLALNPESRWYYRLDSASKTKMIQRISDKLPSIFPDANHQILRLLSESSMNANWLYERMLMLFSVCSYYDRLYVLERMNDCKFGTRFVHHLMLTVCDFDQVLAIRSADMLCEYTTETNIIIPRLRRV